jgi:hypothetical protein
MVQEGVGIDRVDHGVHAVPIVVHVLAIEIAEAVGSDHFIRSAPDDRRSTLFQEPRRESIFRDGDPGGDDRIAGSADDLQQIAGGLDSPLRTGSLRDDRQPVRHG